MYAACLASYNNGCLHGEWFDLEDYEGAAELQRDIAIKVLRTSPHPNVTVVCPACGGSKPEQFFCMCCDKTGEVESAEEWAAHDWEGEGLSDFGEYPNLEEVFAHIRMVSEHGPAWVAFKSAFGDSATEENFEEAYKGQYDSEEAFAEEWTCEMHGWTGDEVFYRWIDWKQAWWSDLQHDFTFCDGYVFYSNW